MITRYRYDKLRRTARQLDRERAEAVAARGAAVQALTEYKDAVARFRRWLLDQDAHVLLTGRVREALAVELSFARKVINRPSTKLFHAKAGRRVH